MLSTNPFFNSLPISTLNFLERSTFASKPREEKIAFMKGLSSVLDRFSEGLRTRKILPSLLEEVGTIFFLRTSPKFYPIADERPAPTTTNPSQRLRNLHQPLPLEIRFAGSSIVEAAFCHQGTTAEYDDTS